LSDLLRDARWSAPRELQQRLLARRGVELVESLYSGLLGRLPGVADRLAGRVARAVGGYVLSSSSCEVLRYIRTINQRRYPAMGITLRHRCEH
jgi:hypothetical protein